MINVFQQSASGTVPLVPVGCTSCEDRVRWPVPLYLNGHRTMFHPTSMTIDLNNGPPLPTPPSGRRNRSFLDRLVAWILKPIEFPGKWPVIEPPSERYNREVQSEPTRPHDQ